MKNPLEQIIPLDPMRRERVDALMTKGIIDIPRVPNGWQTLQGRIYLFTATTRRDKRDLLPANTGTWLSHMPQRGVAQLVFQSFSSDPTGLSRTLDGLIWHVLSLNHKLPENLVYDIEMLASFEGGLEAMARECRAVMRNTHPKAWLAREMVGGGNGYFEMVLEQTYLGTKGEFAKGPPTAHVQTTLDVLLSFPETPQATLDHPDARNKLLSTPGIFLDNILGAVTNTKTYDVLTEGVIGKVA